jgi:hypothetical protein
MIQFNKSQKDNAAVTAAYIAGMDEAGMAALSSSLTYLGIDVGPLDMSGYVSQKTDAETAFDAGGYLLNIGNLIRR